MLLVVGTYLIYHKQVDYMSSAGKRVADIVIHSEYKTNIHSPDIWMYIDPAFCDCWYAFTYRYQRNHLRMNMTIPNIGAIIRNAISQQRTFI